MNPIKKRKTRVKSKQKQRRFQNFLACLEQANEADEPPAVNQSLQRVSTALQRKGLLAFNNGEPSSDDCDATWADDEGGDSSSDDEYRAANHEQSIQDESPFLHSIEENVPSLSKEDDYLVLSETGRGTENEMFSGSSSDSSNAAPLDTSEDDAPLIPLEDDWTEAQLDAHLAKGDEVDGPTELAQFLQDYICSNTTGAAGDRLLKGLKALKHQKNCFDSLPRDVRTLRKTPRKVLTEEKADGAYYHFGLRKGIMNHLPLQVVENRCVKVLVNMDGIPLFKSSRKEFWPILGLFRGQTTPFPIGVWCGVGKPSSANTYLRSFVDEAKELEKNGLLHGGHHLEVEIWGFACDAPARSFITGTRGHTARNACPKCKTQGVYYVKPGKKRGRETFPDLTAELRTHQWFVDQTVSDYGDYHLMTSILEELNVDMVMDIPLDYMHLVCLGVVKKLLSHWVKRETVSHLIRQQDVDELSRRLVHLQGSIPHEFARSPRSLDDLPRFKATEFRQFLLYTGPIILKGVLPDELYSHFMTLHVAIKILSSAETCFKYNSFSSDLLRHFIKQSGKLYGGHFITFNVHCLTHVPLDVLRFGPLDSYSCFPFENFLYQLKKLIRHSRNPLVQLVKRLIEFSHCSSESPLLHNRGKFMGEPVLSGPHSNGVLIEDDDSALVQQYRGLEYRNWKLTLNHPNCYVILVDEYESVVTVENVVQDEDGSIFIIGYPFHDQTPFFLNRVLPMSFFHLAC